VNTQLAVIEGKDIISAVIWIIILGCIFGLLVWLVDYVKLAEPFAKIAKIVLAVAAVLLLINALLGIAGSDSQFIKW
jgi:hypothetical protein